MKSCGISEAMFQGTVSIESTGAGFRAWRLPHAFKRLLNDDLAVKAQLGAGVRLRIQTDSPRVSLRVAPLPQRRQFDLVIDNRLLQSAVVEPGGEAAEFDQLPAASKTLEIWLPHSDPAELTDLLVEDGCAAAPADDRRRRWVTYGSSITQCKEAHSPSRTWPATAARLADVHLTCLGFGGQCHLDPLVATTIRELPADFISLKVGINVQGGSSLSGRTFGPNLIGLVRIIRENHPATPIALISPIISPPRETKENVVGQSLTKMRLQVADAVERLKDCGDGNVHYFDGLELFNEGDLAFLPDQLHPDGEGYELMGRRFVERVLPTLAGAGQAASGSLR